MSYKKTKVKCRLTARGTDKANIQAIDDLMVPDPEFTVGEQIIQLQSELQLLISKLLKHEGRSLSMSETKKIGLEITAKRIMISNLQTRK